MLTRLVPKLLPLLLLSLLPALVGAQGLLVQDAALQQHLAAMRDKFKMANNDEGKRVAVLPIKGDNNDVVRAKIEEAVLDSGKFQLIDRANLQTLITEIEFQEGAEIDSKTVKELKIKGVDYVIIGSALNAAQGAGTVLKIEFKMTSCSTAAMASRYSKSVLMSAESWMSQFLQTVGAGPIIIIGFILLIALVLVFKVFRGAKSAALNTIFATIKDYMEADKKIRENTGQELRQIKTRLKDAAAACTDNDKGDFATSINTIAGDIDLLSQAVTGAPFGQDLAQARAIPRDVAERLKAADLAFTDRVADLGKNVSRLKDLANEKRFDGLDSDINKLKSEVSGLKDKFEERGRILRSF